MKKWALVLALLASIVCLSGCNNKNDGAETVPEFVFSYADNQPENYPTTLGAKYFADLVLERTNGRIKINVYANGEKGTELSVIEQLEFGGIDFGRASIMLVSNNVPELNVLQLPYLYQDREHMWAVLDGQVGDDFMGFLEGHGYVGLSWYDAGARHFYNSVKPIECMEDLQGMKMRVAESNLMYGLVRALGAVPYTLAYPDVYSGLETGVIDRAENNWPSYQFTEHYEVAKYITLDAHNRIPEIQLCAQSTWDKLTADDQQTIRECAKASAQYERELWQETEEKAQDELVKEGCIVTELSPQEQQRFRTAVQPVYDEYASGYEYLIDAIEATR